MSENRRRILLLHWLPYLNGQWLWWGRLRWAVRGVYCRVKKFIHFPCVSKLAIKAKRFILVNYFVADPRTVLKNFCCIKFTLNVPHSVPSFQLIWFIFIRHVNANTNNIFLFTNSPSLSLFLWSIIFQAGIA